MTPRDRYLRAVRAGVPGWSIRRTGMLRELRDGFDDATEAHIEAGMPTEEAERAAAVELGSPSQVAVSMRTELAVGAGRVAVFVTAIFSGVQMVISELVWGSARANGRSLELPAWYGSLAGAVDVLSVVLLVVGLVVAAFLGRSSRTLRLTRGYDRVLMARRAAIGVLVVVAVQGVAGVLLTAYGLGWDVLTRTSPLELLHSPAMPVLEVILAVQCLRLAAGSRSDSCGTDQVAAGRGERTDPMTPLNAAHSARPEASSAAPADVSR